MVGNSLPESEGARARRRDGTGRNEAEESAAAEISTRQSIAHQTEGDDGKKRKKNTDPLRNGTNQTNPPPKASTSASSSSTSRASASSSPSGTPPARSASGP